MKYSIIVIALATASCVLIMTNALLWRMLKRERSKVSVIEAELDTQRKEKEYAQLRFLNLQTKPHFLTNGLSIIYSLALDQKYDMILKMTTYLTRHLQFRYAATGSFVTVNDELERIKNYLDILEIRFPNEITVDFYVDNSVKDKMIAPFSVQPIVDNCWKHGKIPNERLKISVKFMVCNIDGENYIKVTIEDNGRGMTDEALEELNNEKELNNDLDFLHIGINNLKFRLHLLYGKGRTWVSFSGAEPKGAVATILLPEKINYSFCAQGDKDE